MQVQTVGVNASTFVATTQAPAKPKAKQEKLVENLNRVNLKTFIDEQNGLFVSVTFKKIDGDSRILTGRLGVRSYLKGGRNKVEALSRPYLTMFDVQIRQYRTVSLDSVSEIRANNKIYRIVD